MFGVVSEAAAEKVLPVHPGSLTIVVAHSRCRLSPAGFGNVNKYIMEQWLWNAEWGNGQQIKDFRKNLKIYVCARCAVRCGWRSTWNLIFGHNSFDRFLCVRAARSTPRRSDQSNGRAPGENVIDFLVSIRFISSCRCYLRISLSTFVRCMHRVANERKCWNFYHFSNRRGVWYTLFGPNNNKFFGLWCIGSKHSSISCEMRIFRWWSDDGIDVSKAETKL